MSENTASPNETFSRADLVARLQQASAIAHTLSQPLTSALLTAQFVREASEQLATAQPGVQIETIKTDAATIEQNMHQLKNLLDDLRDVVRLPNDIT